MSDFYGIILRKYMHESADYLNRVLDNLSVHKSRTFQRYTHHNFSLCIETSNQIPTLKLFNSERFILLINGRIENDEFNNILIGNKSSFDDYFTNFFEHDNSKLRGNFIIVLFDKYAHKLICLRDQLGVLPLYYFENDNLISFSNHISLLKPLADVSIDLQWIADSISLIKSEKFRTPYKGISRLIPGHSLLFQNKIDIKPYWNFNSTNIRTDLNWKEATEIFLELLTKSILKRIDNFKFIGCELSGGLDSAGVTAIANKLAMQKGISLGAFSHVLATEDINYYFPYKDERSYSDSLTSFIKLKNHFYCTDENQGILNRLKETFEIQSGPTQQGFNIFSDTLYKNANQQGVDLLLSGFGGDEGVSSYGGGFFDEMRLSRKRDIFKYEFLMRSNNMHRSRFISNIAWYISYYMPFIHNYSNSRNNKSRDQIKKSVLKSIDVNFLKSLNIQDRISELYLFPDDPNVLERQLKRITHNHISQRFEYSYFAAKAYNLEYAYPLWDLDLLEFYLSLPAEYKFRNGSGRAIFKEALKSYIPDNIRIRVDKGGQTIPTTYKRIVKDFEQIVELIIRNKALNRYHYLDYNYMLDWAIMLKKRAINKKGIKYKTAYPAAFINAIQIILLQEMQRNGEFDSGIFY